MTSSPTTPFARRDLLAALVVILIWAMNFVALKIGLRAFTPLQLGLLRFLFSAIPLVFLMRPPAIGWRWIVVYGLLQGFGQFGLLILALKVGMTAALAPVVMQTQVFVTALMSAFMLGEKISRTLMIGLCIAGLGLACLAVNAVSPADAGSVTLAGIGLTLLGACCWSASNIVVRKLQMQGASYNPLSLVVWGSVVSAVAFTALSLLVDDAASWQWSQWIDVPMEIWFWVAYVGWIGNVVSYGLWALLLGRYAANRVAPLSLGVPGLGILTGVLMLGETVTSWQLVGGGLVMTALVFVLLGGKRKAR
jgi:O-acetylserine/cysteine efflux transporter